jgi:hypothetical protein
MVLIKPEEYSGCWSQRDTTHASSFSAFGSYWELHEGRTSETSMDPVHQVGLAGLYRIGSRSLCLMTYLQVKQRKIRRSVYFNICSCNNSIAS